MAERSLGAEVLIDKVSESATRWLIDTENILDYYLHLPGGAVSVGQASSLEQVIQSVEIPGPDQEFVRAMFRHLDALIDLDFHEVISADVADINLFCDLRSSWMDQITLLVLQSIRVLGDGGCSLINRGLKAMKITAAMLLFMSLVML